MEPAPPGPREDRVGLADATLRPSPYDADYFTARGGAAAPGPGSYQHRLVDALVAEVAPRRALDVGCGTGVLVDAFRRRGVDAWGVDLSDAARAMSRVPERLRPFDAMRDALPFPDATFDLVTMVEFVEHLPHTDHLLPEVRRVLAPQGTVFQQTPIPGTSEARADPTHVNVQSRRSWIRVYRQHGFRPDPAALYRMDRRLPVGPRGRRMPSWLRYSPPARWYVALRGTRTLFRVSGAEVAAVRGPVPPTRPKGI